MQRSLRILLAEDDPDDSYLFREALHKSGSKAELVIVQDGEMLIDLLAEIKGKPDLIFLDLNMPKKDGYACLKEIRGNASLQKVPVIILSTSSNEQSVDHAYSGGANLYIRKPDNFKDLVTAISFCLQRSTELGIIPSKENFLLVP